MAIGIDYSVSEHPLLKICEGWLAQIEAAKTVKKKEFGETADWAMKKYDGPAQGEESLWEEVGKGAYENGSIDPPAFLMSVNKLAEIAQLYGPALYVKNPNIRVTATKQPMLGPEALGIPTDEMSMQDPQIQQALQQFQQMGQQQQMQDQMKTSGGVVLEKYLNWSQFELDKKRHARKWITEAILKGMGVCWTEIYQPPGFNYACVGSFYDTVDNLLLDPDAEEWSQMKWCARRRVEHIWEVAEKFGIDEEVLREKATLESRYSQNQSKSSRRKRSDRNRHKANDLMEYYEIYSKAGFGDRMALDNTADKQRGQFDDFGDYVYLAVAKGIPYPLNMPTDALVEDEEELFLRAAWPIPFWADKDGWPFTSLFFHEHPNKVWPIAHYKFARAECAYLDWAMSFLATKTATSCNTVVASMKSAGDDIKNALKRSEGGYNFVELPEAIGQKISEVISFLQPPEFNADIFKVAAEVENNADKRLGLNEMMYAEVSRQMRSAAEANIRQDYATTRPDDFANKTEDSLSRMATKEAFAMRWLLKADDVQPVVGSLGGAVWNQVITSTDVEWVVREFDYRIESGSTRKPNKAAMTEQANMAMQSLGPIMQGYWQAMGDPDPLNALIQFWAKAHDYEDDQIQKMMLKPPQPPPPPEEDPAWQEEQRRKEEEHDQELRHDQESHQLDMFQEVEEGKVKNRIAEALASNNNGAKK